MFRYCVLGHVHFITVWKADSEDSGVQDWILVWPPDEQTVASHDLSDFVPVPVG